MTGRRRNIALPPWLDEPAIRAVRDALEAGGIEIRFVGGAVRDALLGGPGAGEERDIDIATPAPPARVVELLERAGIKVVPTGLAHGTVTAIVPPRHFEITTLRRDVETFGRRARVAFDADWEQDASRRDFTINAIYLDPDGGVHDPVGGLADLHRRRVRFVGDAGQRIAEDVLRLLRYYRFEARFGSGAGDAAARAACRAAAHLLPTLSAERVGQELMRLFANPDPSSAVRMMQADGVLATVLPEGRRLDRLQRMIAAEPEPDALRRLAALVEVDVAGAEAVARRLRLANAGRDRLRRLVPPWPLAPAGDLPAQRLALYRLGPATYRDLGLLLAADQQVDRARLGELLTLAASWAPPSFPLSGRDITALGVAQGERIGRLLGMVRDWWEAGDFAADRAECLAYLRRVALLPALPQEDGNDAKP